VRGWAGGQVLGYRDVDELVEGDALGFGGLACLLQQRRLQPQCEIALPHAFASQAVIASAGVHTPTPKRVAPESKCFRLNVTIHSARPFTAVSSTMSSSGSCNVGRHRNARRTGSATETTASIIVLTSAAEMRAAC